MERRKKNWQKPLSAKLYGFSGYLQLLYNTLFCFLRGTYYSMKLSYLFVYLTFLGLPNYHVSSMHWEFGLQWGMSRVKETILTWIGLVWKLWKSEWAWLKRIRWKDHSLPHSVYVPSSPLPTHPIWTLLSGQGSLGGHNCWGLGARLLPQQMHRLRCSSPGKPCLTETGWARIIGNWYHGNWYHGTSDTTWKGRAVSTPLSRRVNFNS